MRVLISEEDFKKAVIIIKNIDDTKNSVWRWVEGGLYGYTRRTSAKAIIEFKSKA